MPINDYKFGLNDVKIAEWNSAENYGTAQDVLSVQMMGFQLQTETGELEGDDIITAIHAKHQSAQVQLRFAFQDLAVLAILTGVTHAESDYNESMVWGRDNMPYFAICGRVDGVEGDGDTQIFVPKCKIMDSALNITMEKGNWVIEDVTAMAVYEGSTYGIGKVVNNATAQSVTIPPTGATS